MAGRTFIVRVNEGPRRVVVEDVRAQRTVVVPSVTAVGSCIARLLDDDAPEPTPAREDSVSAPP